MKKLFIILIVAGLLGGIGSASAQRSFTRQEAREIYDRYRAGYPDGLWSYVAMQDKPTYKGGGLDKLKIRITTYLDNRHVSYGSSSIYSFVVDKKGKVRDIEVAGPNEKQNEAVKKAIKGTKWTPGTVAGEPVDVFVISGVSLIDN